MRYQSTLLEDAITQFYSHLNIKHPRQLKMINIADILGIKIYFFNITSRTYKGNIVIDSRLSPEEQWEEFAHELCHILFQYGNQLLHINSLFLAYQERKANNFILHFCIPTFMLLKYEISTIPEAIPIIVNEFKVTHEIAEKKLIHYRNQLIQSNLSHRASSY